MSTTGGTPEGTVLVLDEPKVIEKKIKRAVTDSGSEIRSAPDKPGVTNLIEIMAVATGQTPEAIEARYDGTGYGQFKEEVAEAVVQLLDPIRLRYGELRGRPHRLAEILAHGAEKAHAIARETLARVHERVGFVPP